MGLGYVASGCVSPNRTPASTIAPTITATSPKKPARKKFAPAILAATRDVSLFVCAAVQYSTSETMLFPDFDKQRYIMSLFALRLARN
eukprot:m.490337 g.490337  ORF g.490337 m.490337 type:complete len:88 (-) comp27832_c0_seq1:118-381(-)